MAKKKNDETPIETHVETSLKQNDETSEDTENYLNTTMLNEMIHLRVDGHLSMRQIAEKTGVSLATVSRILKGVNSLEATEEDEEEENDEEDTDLENEEEPSLKISTQVPEGYVLRPGITPEQFAKFSKMKKEELVAQLVESESERTSLRSQVQLRKGDGEEQHSKYVEPPLSTRETIQYAQTQKLLDALTSKPNDSLTEDKIERIVERAVERHGKGDNIEKAVEVIGEIFEKAQGRGKESNPFDYYRLGRADQEKLAIAGSGKQTNEYDLKNTELQNIHDIEMKKLGWEMAKFEKGESTTEKLLETIKEVLGSPAIGGAVQELGRAAASKISTMKDGQKVTCPNCRATFFVNPALQTVQCVNCGATLAKQAPQPSEQPQEPQPLPKPSETQEPQTETPQTPTENLSKKTEPEVI